MTLQSRIVRSPDQAFAQVGDELVMVYLDQDLQATFDVAADECERVVLAFLMGLVARGPARVA